MQKLVVFLALVSIAVALPRWGGNRSAHKIVGGGPVDIKNHPYQLALLYYGAQICGASSLSRKVALTAAHCVDEMDFTRFSVRSGSNLHDAGGVVVKVDRVIPHPLYNFKIEYDYDVAVLVLERNIDGNFPWSAVSLTLTEPTPGTEATITGWGDRTSGGDDGPRELYGVNVLMKNIEDCKKMYPTGVISQRMICAAAAGKDSCQGDSGGPLVVKGTTKQIGVVSWGYGCADARYPGLYSNVAELNNWISSAARMAEN